MAKCPECGKNGGKSMARSKLICVDCGREFAGAWAHRCKECYKQRNKERTARRKMAQRWKHHI